MILLTASMSPTELAAVVVATVSVVGAVATVIVSFRNSASSVKNDIIDTYETRLKQVEGEVAKLTVELKETNGKLKLATDILQGRNPELEKYMAISLKMLSEIHENILRTPDLPK